MSYEASPCHGFLLKLEDIISQFDLNNLIPGLDDLDHGDLVMEKPATEYSEFEGAVAFATLQDGKDLEAADPAGLLIWWIENKLGITNFEFIMPEELLDGVLLEIDEDQLFVRTETELYKSLAKVGLAPQEEYWISYG